MGELVRIVFMGSARLSCPSLDSLVGLSDVEIVAVVTQPARPKGRHLRPAVCIAGDVAAKHGLRVLTPVDVNAPESVEVLRDLAPDMIAVVAYGQILRARVLGLARCGCVNVHASLLPKYRGAAPVQWAIARGEMKTGVTTIFMNEKMDDGDIIMQAETDIGDDETAGELRDRLAVAGADLLTRTVAAIRAGKAPRRPQDPSQATLARRLKKADGRIDWARSATDIHNMIRGLNPWPVCFCSVRGTRAKGGAGGLLRVFRSRVERGRGDAGEILDRGENGPLVATGQEALRLLEVHPEGRKRMTGAAYLRGHDLGPGMKLE